MNQPEDKPARAIGPGAPGRAPRWWLLALLALSVLLGIARILPQVRENARLARHEHAGDEHFRKGEGAAAEARWRAVLDARPRAPGTRNKLAIVCMQQERFDEARDLLREGLRLRPRETSFRYNLALLACMEQDFDTALTTLDAVEKTNPGHGRLHYLKGVILEAQGKHDLAQEEFVKELNSDPATPQAWIKLGVLSEDAHTRTWMTQPQSP